MRRARRIPLSNAWPIAARLTALRAPWYRPLTLTWRAQPRGVPRQAVRWSGIWICNHWSPRFSLRSTRSLPNPARKGAAIPIWRTSTTLLRHSGALRTVLQTFVRSQLETERRRSSELMRRELRISSRSNTEVRLHEISRAFRASAAQRWRLSRSGTAMPKPALLAAPHFAIESATFHAAAVASRTAEVRRHVKRVRLAYRWSKPRTGPAAPANETARPLSVPQLIWRTDADARTVEAIERYVSSAMPVWSNSPPPKIFEESASISPSHAQMLDPALMDRVAEDVMGRMERRIRIERERRGI